MPIWRRVAALLAASIVSVFIVQRGIKFFYERYKRK